MNFGVTILEIVMLSLYSVYIKKKNIKLISGSCLIFGITDLSILTLEAFFKTLIPIGKSNIINYIFDLIINIIIIFITKKYNIKIKNRLLDKNSSILVGVLVYIYITGYVVNYLVFSENEPSKVLQFSLGLLLFQAIFAILLYVGAVRIQKEVLTEQQQKRMEAENQQLKEYSNYLDKNEDELRHFKHDYENLLNSLKISAEKGDSKSVVKQLAKYTNSQFDEKALRKYKGVNHIHVEELKSIAITKLAKLYNEKIPYSFGCEVEIYDIPKIVNIFDLVRIIGVAFDNTIEESQNLIKRTGDNNSAKVDAMYYQEDGNFEFKIRNRISKGTTLSPNVLSQEGYSTKQHHTGIGLANVKRIESKYEEFMLINYEIKNGWFTFELEIIPDNESMEED
ncbi:GHKL domain-containing protein [Lactobacillus helveticus]|uniref:GHKL domain-containing protein n=1 Tax=Lactobacillus helveticus TaxID=1587 RepID=UPI0021ABE106|nr:GHKL domain-containing protein [Lactobacillus helveticus]